MAIRTRSPDQFSVHVGGRQQRAVNGDEQPLPRREERQSGQPDFVQARALHSGRRHRGDTGLAISSSESTRKGADGPAQDVTPGPAQVRAGSSAVAKSTASTDCATTWFQASASSPAAFSTGSIRISPREISFTRRASSSIRPAPGSSHGPVAVAMHEDRPASSCAPCGAAREAAVEHPAAAERRGPHPRRRRAGTFPPSGGHGERRLPRPCQRPPPAPVGSDRQEPGSLITTTPPGKQHPYQGRNWTVSSQVRHSFHRRPHLQAGAPSVPPIPAVSQRRHGARTLSPGGRRARRRRCR